MARNARYRPGTRVNERRRGWKPARLTHPETGLWMFSGNRVSQWKQPPDRLEVALGMPPGLFGIGSVGVDLYFSHAPGVVSLVCPVRGGS